MTTMLLRPPIQQLVKRTVVHVEDEAVYELNLRRTLVRGDIDYYRTGLVSEAALYLHEELVVGFVVDVKLQQEREEEFENWGAFSKNSLGLIEKIRRERPDLPVVVLTNFYADLDLHRLIQRGILDQRAIFRKMQQTDEAVVRALIGQLTLPDDDPDLAEMEPNLQYLVIAAQGGCRIGTTASTREGEVAVLALLDDIEDWRSMDGVRPGIAIRQGKEWIVTGRVRWERLAEVQRKVRRLEASVHLQPIDVAVDQLLSGAELHPPFLTQGSGRGSVLGVVDFGCDFAHPRFRTEDGKTRLLALWDQDGNDYGDCDYGAFFKAEKINEALAAEDPYANLGYWPPEGAHGTHVLDIAAGNGSDWSPGPASRAHLIFVELSTGAAGVPWESDKILGSSLGGSVQFVEALERIFRVAGERPCVINASVGENTGPHDGTTLVEEAIDALVQAAPNRAVVLAAGNDRNSGLHGRGRLSKGGNFDLRWSVEENDGRHLKLDLWYSRKDTLAAELISPSGESLCHVPLGGRRTGQRRSGLPRFVVAHPSPREEGRDRIVGVFLGPHAEAGEWTLRLHGDQIVDGTFHAWIERRNRPARFASPDPDCTLNGLACGRQSIAVGSYNGHEEDHPCSSFSGAGPTRDDRWKPDLCAPGERIRAARARSQNSFEDSGTSMAAPYVAGCLAALLAEMDAQGHAVSVHELQNILHLTLGDWDNRIGRGRLP